MITRSAFWTHLQVLVFVLLLLLVGCADGEIRVQEKIASVPLAQDSLELPSSTRQSDEPLPAWRTEEEQRSAAKDDSFDVRGTYQDIYGVTPPPAGPVRAVAEFERTDGVLISWDWYFEDFFVDLVDAVTKEAVAYVITDSLNDSRRVQGVLARNGVNAARVRYFEFENNSFWTRDYGPITVAKADGTAAMIGAAYFDYRQHDDAIPTLMGRYFNLPTYRPNLYSEGGNFMTNGSGLCAITDAVLLNNSRLTYHEVMEIKRDYYGCEETLIVESMHGEETGHIDMFAKFVSEDTIIVGSYEPSDDRRNSTILDRNANLFAQHELEDGRSLRVVRIPMPKPDRPVYRSYTNSTIVNDTIIVPVYSRERQYESAALQVYRSAAPNHTIVTLESEGPIQYGGAVHCATMGFALGNLRPANDDLESPGGDYDDPGADDWGNEQAVGPMVYESAPNAPIRDLQSTVDTISVPHNSLITQVILEVEIEHTYVGDLIISLVRDGDEFTLYRQEGGATRNLHLAWSFPSLVGTDRYGDWTLVIEDTARQDEGVLRRWTLQIE